MNNKLVGVFDSGVGGLTVVKQLQKIVPNYSIIYLGDTGRCPYGIKSRNIVKNFSEECVDFLSRFNVAVIVIACNTTSSVALSYLKQKFKIPLLGVIEPGVKKALGATKNLRIGVIGTKTTIESNSYASQILRYNPKAKVYSTSCPLFVPLVEEGWSEEKILQYIAEKYLSKLKTRKIDTLILGCTHYPLLKRTITKVVGEKVNLIDSAEQIAYKVKEITNNPNNCKFTPLEKTTTNPVRNEFSGKVREIALTESIRKKDKFFVTDDTEGFSKIAKRFLGRRLINAKKIKIG